MDGISMEAGLAGNLSLKKAVQQRPTSLWHLELLVIANELSGRWWKWFLHWVNGWTKDFSILDLIPRFYVSRIKKDLDKFWCGRNHYKFLLEAEIQYNTNLWSNIKEKGREEERDKRTLMCVVRGPVLKFILSHVILTITLWGVCDQCHSYRCSERLSDLPTVTQWISSTDGFFFFFFA